MNKSLYTRFKSAYLVLDGLSTHYTGHSEHKSSELLKNGLVTIERKIPWKTCIVCLKFIDVTFPSTIIF